jgi:hypothetical protein
MTDYEAGLENGKRIEREAILEYIEHHPKATLSDIIDEIEARYKFDQKMKLGGIKWTSMN